MAVSRLNCMYFRADIMVSSSSRRMPRYLKLRWRIFHGRSGRLLRAPQAPSPAHHRRSIGRRKILLEELERTSSVRRALGGLLFAKIDSPDLAGHGLRQTGKFEPAD